MPLDRVPARLTEVTVDDETAVYNPITDTVVLLNASASEIWRRTPLTSLEHVAVELAEHFGIEPREALAGVQAGVELLLREQLLVEVPGVDGPSAGA